MCSSIRQLFSDDVTNDNFHAKSQVLKTNFFCTIFETPKIFGWECIYTYIVKLANYFVACNGLAVEFVVVLWNRVYNICTLYVLKGEDRG